jgi:beta-carotene hydroxylase
MAYGVADTKAPRAAIGLTHAEEKRIALSLSPRVAWPTLALALVLPASLVGLLYLGLSGSGPYWFCTPALGLVMYAHYSLVHESIHGNVVSRSAHLAWVNTTVGWIGALGLGAGWPILQRTHVLHHSHTNTELDPDIGVKGSFASLIVKWLIGIPMNLLPLFMLRWLSPRRYAGVRNIITAREMLLTSAVGVAHLLILALAAATGYFEQWVFLFLIPRAIAGFILMTFFSWLPHHPFDSTDRYKNTRISLWPGGTFLLLQQNLHLMHHLWPSVPFYNYRKLYKALHPVLVIEGARIEGLLVGPYRKRVVDPRASHLSASS